MFAPLVYLTVFVISTCGLVYQLLAGAVASYLLGDSVTQFSIVIGVFLSALGLGAFLSRHIDEAPGRAFVDASYAAAVVGGLGPTLLYFAFARSGFFRPVLYTVTVASGTLVGIELPLLMRVLRRHLSLRELAARALTVDYAGAVAGSLLFSLLVVPRFGLLRTGLLFGLVNACAALAATWVLGPAVGPPGELRLKGGVAVLALAVLFLYAGRINAHAEDGMYPDPVIFARRTPYQRIVLTAGRGSMQLFLDGNLQFASVDEHRYHEALVHPAFAAARSHRRVLVLGGGDGLAAREILRYPDVERVTLVDLDPGMTDLGRTFPQLVELNERSLHSSRVQVINADAMVWLGTNEEIFDVVIVDFPDPNNFTLGKLYTTRFYALLRRHLHPGSVATVQSTSPLMARQSFWCIVRTLEAAGLRARPYHAFVPSFGEWGYVLAAPAPLEIPTHTLPGLRYLTDALLPTLFVFSADMAPLPAEVNRLNNQVLVQYYEREWRRYD
jgi:spermidine synthase